MFRDMHGTVYIFENIKAQRIKVGMTIGQISNRLNDVNDMWQLRKVTCQVCGVKRLLKQKGLMPQHSIGVKNCSGSNQPPLEKDVKLAILRLENLKKSKLNLSGSNKASVTKIINNLESKIELYKNYSPLAGFWALHTSYTTDSAERAELLSHKFLSEFLDKKAPFGEVFCCTVAEGEKAVEKALTQLGLIKSVNKEIQSNETSPKYGTCIICRGDLTIKKSCPNCINRYL